MKIAFLMSEQALRTRLAGGIQWANATVEEYPTAAKALPKLTGTPYDLIAMHWKVYPGVGSGDGRFEELAGIIPNAELNRNVFYWVVGLRVIDLIRQEDSENRATPVIAMFPVLAPVEFGGEDQLSRESVESDIAARQPAEALYGFSVDEFSEAVTRHLAR